MTAECSWWAFFGVERKFAHVCTASVVVLSCKPFKPTQDDQVGIPLCKALERQISCNPPLQHFKLLAAVFSIRAIAFLVGYGSIHLNNFFSIFLKMDDKQQYTEKQKKNYRVEWYSPSILEMTEMTHIFCRHSGSSCCTWGPVKGPGTCGDHVRPCRKNDQKLQEYIYICTYSNTMEYV